MRGNSISPKLWAGAQWLSLVTILAACEFDDPDPAGADGQAGSTALAASGRTPPSATVPPSSARAASAGASAALSARAPVVASAGQPPAQRQLASTIHSPAVCPEDMREVQGAYCHDLMHRCIKGGKNHLGDDTDEPEPFYCDVYQTGFAECLGKQEPKHFCIDEFEYPNQFGAIPMVMVSWYEAQRLCRVQGKRLCGDDEWTLACEGPDLLPYPYGWARDRTACNIDHLWVAPNDGLLANKAAPPADIEAEVERLSKRVSSGSMPRCVSPFGVMDMTGNVDEWAVNVTYDGKPYQSLFKGGHWVKGARNRCRPVTTSHDESTAYYAEGFRCCANVARSAPR